ncbi:MAG: DapH/DapD/GlmU-related protein [Clostridiaceae bacterium]
MINGYSFSELISSSFSLLATKLFYPGARLVRRPFYIRGKAFMQYGSGFTTGHHCRFDINNDAVEGNSAGEKRLIIGKNCKIGDNVHLVASKKVIIGDDCLFASKIFISDTNHGDYSNIEHMTSPSIAPDDRPLYTAEIRIGNRVWIGENVVILPGVSIGNGVIIGANSVVNRNVPENCIVAGSPARVIKTWNDEQKQWIKA